MAALEKEAVSKSLLRDNIMGYELDNGKRICVIAEGRLVNIAAADGHPAEIMDMSFAVQALSALYVKENRKKLTNKVYNVSGEIDMLVAHRKLGSWGIVIDRLTEEQKKYFAGWQG